MSFLDNLELVSGGTCPARNWSFVRTPAKEIDYSLIYAELSYEQPIALLQMGKSHMRKVIVQTTLAEKAAAMCLPFKDFKQYSGFEVTESEVGEVLQWAADVKRARWPEGLKTTVKVSIPKIPA